MEKNAQKMLNKKSEFVAKCRHKRKFMLEALKINEKKKSPKKKQRTEVSNNIENTTDPVETQVSTQQITKSTRNNTMNMKYFNSEFITGYTPLTKI